MFEQVYSYIVHDFAYYCISHSSSVAKRVHVIIVDISECTSSDMSGKNYSSELWSC